jgi:hypothetical protein
MNIIKKHKLISTFLKLKNNVSSFGDISLGGSTVLYTKGLIDRSPKDLDILCSGNEKSLIKLFKFLSEMYPVKNRYYGSYNSNQMEGCMHHFRFMYILKAKEFYLSKLPTNHPSYKKHNKDITQIKNRL